MSPRHLGPRRARGAVAALSAAFVGAATLTTVTTTTATAAADECVTYLASDDVEEGQEVNGLTTVKGTEPEGFTGEILGVSQDGIAPGVDMIIADLDSPSLQRTGSWAGISGSPVYADAEQTQLVGSVSYGLNEGKTTVVGITPAADIEKVGKTNDDVRLSRAMAARAVASGGASRSEAASGMKPFPTPISISGLSPRRFAQLEGWFDDHGQVTDAGAGSASSSATAADIVPGGNVAASLGYGFVTAAAVGTATAVCGDDVIAFGHPFNYAGESTYSMHPATAVTVVPGTTFSGYKLANPGNPVGTFTQDRLAGIRGQKNNVLPEYYDVTATANEGERSLTGTTKVSVAELVSDAGLANSFAVSDRVLDRSGKGSATSTWTIKGERRNGAPFELTSSDVFASQYDVASAPLTKLAQQLFALTENSTEAVTITGITTDTTFDDNADTYQVGRTYRRVNGAWKRITGKAPAVVRAGRTAAVRVELYSRTAETRYVVLRVTAAKKSAGRLGQLVVEGNDSGDGYEEFYDESEIFWDEYEDEILGGDIGETIPETLARLKKQAKNDSLTSTFSARGTKTAKKTISLGKVVSGYAVVPVRITR